MTQTSVSLTLSTVAGLRAVAPPPVLIVVPNLANPAGKIQPRVRRRRLRREVRFAGYALLVIFPLSLALGSFGGDRFPSPAPGDRGPVPSRIHPTISLAPLEPIVAVERDRETPVFLPGYLLPADTPEDMSHGGH